MSGANRGINRRQFLTKILGQTLALAIPVSGTLSTKKLPSDITQMSATQLKDYSEPVSFRRAFVRWNEMTPIEYRQQFKQSPSAKF